MSILESIFRPFLKKEEPEKTTVSEIEEDYNTPYEILYSESGSSRKDKNATIERCRRLLSNEIEAREAVEDIKNDAIVEEDNVMVMEPAFINETLANSTIKKTLKSLWNDVYQALDLTKNASKDWERWYRDGSLPLEDIYYKDDLEKGVIDVKRLDPIKISVKKSKKGYYGVYSKDGVETKIPEERFSIAFSGIRDETDSFYVSYLNYAIRPINQLNSILQSVILYALGRTKEQTIYYVTTPSKNNQKINKKFVRDFAEKNKSTYFYNRNTGEVVNQKDNISLNKDIFIGVKGDGKRNLEIERQAPDRFGIGEIPVIDFLLDRAYRSLMVGGIRNEGDTASISFDSSASEEKKEVRYFRMLIGLRRHFAEGYLDVLKKHAISTGEISQEEWNDISRNIYMKYNNGNNYYEKQKLNGIKSKMEVIETIASYLEKDANGEANLFPKEFVYKKIMGWDDEKIKEVEKMMAKDREEIEKNSPEPDQEVEPE